MDEAVREFVAEAREGVEALDNKLVRFERRPDDVALLADIFRLFHSLKGGAGFLGLPRLAAIGHAAEDVLGAFRDGELAVTPPAVTVILEALDAVRGLLDALAASGVEPAGEDGSLVARIAALTSAPASTPSPPARALLERLGGEATADAAVEAAVGRMVADPEIGPAFAGVDLDRLQESLREALCAAARAGGGAGRWTDALGLAFGQALDAPASARFGEALAEALLALEADPAAVDVVLADRPAGRPEAAGEPPATSSGEREAPQTIRVAVEALENLMTTVSELVLIRNQLLQTLRAQPDTPFAAPLHRLNQVTSELQEGVMTARMQPVAGAWAKLPRLVRDLAAELGKRIDLHTTGEDTELDRQVLELIRDPLVHMIRNAADHGLETPEARRAAGKPETGRISLSARHEGGAIVLEIADDGRGLCAARIRARAQAQGLVTAAEAAALSDAEARRLIFAPGFSTTETVTAVSGRGVGMDVVRTQVEKIGGAVEVHSVEGEGSRFTIRIPLTLSIISALIVEAGGERFALPQSCIVELVGAAGPGARRAEEINGAPVLRLRDRLLPLVSLQALLGLSPAADARDTCIVVCEAAGFTFGAVVDRVFDTEEIVVKPVSSVLRHLRLYSGATILGDGSVIMILDAKGASMEAGASGLTGVGEEAAAPASATAPTVQTEPMLVFHAGGGAPKAARLGEVARIEELEPAALERLDGCAVLQYRGRLTPVLQVDGRPAQPCDRRRPLLIFSRGERHLALQVDEIVDVTEGVAERGLTPAKGGVAAGAVIDGRAAELIEVDWYWRCAAGEAEPEPRPAAPAAEPLAGPGRRLLIVDRSPFVQLLLRPFLAQAGYAVEVAGEPEAAVALHDAGRRFDLILADTAARGPEGARLAAAFARAPGWRDTPLLGLGPGGLLAGPVGLEAAA